MNLCSHCGAPLREGAKECEYCGMPVEQEEEKIQRQETEHGQKAAHGKGKTAQETKEKQERQRTSPSLKMTVWAAKMLLLVLNAVLSILALCTHNTTLSSSCAIFLCLTILMPSDFDFD